MLDLRWSVHLFITHWMFQEVCWAWVGWRMGPQLLIRIDSEEDWWDKEQTFDQ